MSPSKAIKLLRDNPKLLVAGAARKLALVLAKAGPSPLSNFEYNKSIWDAYSARWTKQTATKDRESCLQALGDEWGRAADVVKIVEEYIYPYVDANSVVAEIGVGGGRIAAKVAPKCQRLQCYDISANMLERAKVYLAGRPNVTFTLLDRPQLNAASQTFDFVYSFDVFVHLDLHMMWKYFRDFERVLKPGGHAFVHTTNLKAPGGWEHFAQQDHYTVEGHYPVVPETVALLAERCGLKIVKSSSVDPRNYYLNRDYLAILKKN